MASRRRRNRKPLLPLKERMERLKRHFSGIEHFSGSRQPTPKPVNLKDAFAVQFAVLECCWRQKLSTAETAEAVHRDYTKRVVAPFKAIANLF